MKYKDAIAWIVENDDVDWIDHPGQIPCRTASMLFALSGKTEQQVINDIRYESIKQREYRFSVWGH